MGAAKNYEEKVIERKFEGNIKKNREKLSNWIHKWMETVESKTDAEPPILYVNSNYATNYLDSSTISKYDLWIAHWTCDTGMPPPDTEDTGIWDSWDFWQYYEPDFCGENSVAGISGGVDLDVFNGDMSKLKDEFVIKKKPLLDVVLIIDRSGSMSSPPEQFPDTQTAAKTFADLLDPANDRVGLVSYATSATLNQPLTSTYQDVKNTIDTLSPSGNTAMGEGIYLANNELLTNGRSRPPTVYAGILLCDGQWNQGGDPIPQAQAAANNDIVIYTIGLGDMIDESRLMTIAEITGGDYYYAPTSEELEDIYIELSGRVAGLTPIKTEEDRVAPDETIPKTFFVDATIDMFRTTLNWTGSDVDLKLKDRGGNYILPDGNVRYSGSDAKPEWYEVTNPAPGSWQAEIYGKDVPEEGEDFTMQVMASTPVTLSVNTDKTDYDGGESVLITAELLEGTEPITGADVSAEIIRPDTSVETLKLYDDGSHQDANSDDGIYTSDYSKTCWVGTYNVEAVATDGFERADTTSFRVVTAPANTPPVANAGSDQTVYVTPPATTAEVTLDGSGSYDSDGDPLTYSWTWDGNTATGVNPTIELPHR